MRMKAHAAAVAVLMVAMGRSSPFAADRDTLKGLRTVDVLVEDLAPEAERDGLATMALKANIESQLKKGGVDVSEDATETFYVNVNAHPTGPADGRYMYNIEVRVSQPAVVLRTNSVTMAITWSRATVGTRLLNVFPAGVREDLLDLIATFLNDYAAVNPKP